MNLSWKISLADAGKLLKKFLAEQNISRTALRAIKFQGGSILVNGNEQNTRTVLQVEDSVHIVFPPEVPSEQIIPERLPLDIVYEDEAVLVINKPAGMSTIPSEKHPLGNLANVLLYHYQQIGLTSTIHVVTRLDRDTSGLVLIAKHRHIHHLLSQAQQKHQIKRVYEALVSGVIAGEQVIEAPIGRKVDSIIERQVRSDGKYALTYLQSLTVHRGKYSHIRLRLETGRTHQIRVHLAHIGHPLLGDDLYGGSRQLIPRQALHCCQLAFLHPIMKKELLFVSALPADLAQLVE